MNPVFASPNIRPLKTIINKSDKTELKHVYEQTVTLQISCLKYPEQSVSA